jgi:hypothetical protein
VISWLKSVALRYFLNASLVLFKRVYVIFEPMYFLPVISRTRFHVWKGRSWSVACHDGGSASK